MQPKQPKAETQAMSEYGEPWSVDAREQVVMDWGGVVMSNECQTGILVRRRIVSCVNVMQGIPNPEAVRELIHWAKIWNETTRTDEAHWEAEFQMSEALALLSAPSASPQQK